MERPTLTLFCDVVAAAAAIGRLLVGICGAACKANSLRSSHVCCASAVSLFTRLWRPPQPLRD